MGVTIARIDQSSPGSNDPAGGDPSQRPWRLLLRAVGWIVLAMTTSFMVVLITAFVVGVQRGIAMAHHLPVKSPSDFSATVVYTTIILQLMLLWGAVRGARLAAGGDLGAGLADRRVKRRGRVAWCAALMLIWDTAAVGTLGWIVAHGGHPPALSPTITRMPDGIGPVALHIVLLGLLAPVAEEFFFRGWLWTALRRSWSPSWTLTCTTGLWVLIHFTDGTWRGLVLLPTGVLLGLARHYGDSVRASLTLHLMNNGLIVLIQLAPLLLAGHSAPG